MLGTCLRCKLNNVPFKIFAVLQIACGFCSLANCLRFLEVLEFALDFYSLENCLGFLAVFQISLDFCSLANSLNFCSLANCLRFLQTGKWPNLFAVLQYALFHVRYFMNYTVVKDTTLKAE